MSEYAVDLPVWDVTRVPDKEYLRTPQSLDIRSALVADLIAWQRLFEENCHWQAGRRDSAAQDQYAARGPQLQDRLQAELGRDVDVVLDLWPAEGT